MAGALAVMLLGPLCLVVGIVTWPQTHRLTRGTGTIADVERDFAGRTKAYFPVVSFQALDGAEVRKREFSPGGYFVRSRSGRVMRDGRSRDHYCVEGL